MKQNHIYRIDLRWIGKVNIERNYRYEKTYELDFDNKPKIIGSADPTFHGDKTLYNPEEMLLAALSSCHMMSFFYLCGRSKIIIESYTDQPLGTLKVNSDGSGQFEEVLLQPSIKTTANKTELEALFTKAGDYCFIARSCNFKIKHQPSFIN